MEITRGGEKITVTAKEFKTLEFLTKNAERVISWDELLNDVWGYQNYPCTRTVDNHILRLRKKLESDPTHRSAATAKPTLPRTSRITRNFSLSAMWLGWCVHSATNRR
jgi:DNA-binding response OmpR family regulator